MTTQSNQSKKPISANINDVEAFMKEQVGTGLSFDLGFREIIIMKKKIQLYYVTGLTDTSITLEVIKKLIDINDNETNTKKIPEIIKNRLVHQQVEVIKTMDEAVDQVLSGLMVIFVNGEKQGYVVDVRSYPGRQPSEPDTEQVIRGSRDGYTENIIVNTALTRRRVRDARLRNEMLKVGERSKTDVCVSYIQDIADDGLVKVIKEKIQAIEVDGITMADKAVEEFIIKRKWSPFPLVRYTERPDVAATHLLEGHVLITVDTSPSVIILPTTYFHHLQHAEEYRQAPAVGTFIRLLRYIGVLASIFLLPLWLLFVMEPSLLPKQLSFIGLNEEGNIPVAVGRCAKNARTKAPHLSGPSALGANWPLTISPSAAVSFSSPFWYQRNSTLSEKIKLANALRYRFSCLPFSVRGLSRKESRSICERPGLMPTSFISILPMDNQPCPRLFFTSKSGAFDSDFLGSLVTARSLPNDSNHAFMAGLCECSVALPSVSVSFSAEVGS